MNDKITVGIVGSKFAADFHTFSYRRNPAAEIAAATTTKPARPNRRLTNF